MSRYNTNRFQNDRYNRSNQYDNRYQKQNKKRSGAKFKNDKNQNMFVSGWRVSRAQGYVTFTAGYTSKTTESKITDSGKKWANVLCTIVFHRTGQIFREYNLLDITNRRLYFKDRNWIATSKGSGGYFGKHK